MVVIGSWVFGQSEMCCNGLMTNAQQIHIGLFLGLPTVDYCTEVKTKIVVRVSQES